MKENLRQARVFVFDTETTGTSTEDDRIVELGAAYFEAGRKVRLHRMLVNPGQPIPPEASQIHGVWDKDVADAPDFGVVGRRLAMHLDGSVLGGRPPVLAGYNAVTFDAPLVNAELTRHGIAARIDPARVVDPLVFMKWHHREMRSRKLTEASARYEIRLVNAHTAAADAQATGELLMALVRAGRMPDEVETCLREQVRLSDLMEAEYAEWRNWLYRDRVTGALRVGAGRVVGTPVEAVDPGWYRFVLEHVEDLPEAVKREFARWV